MPIEIQKLIGEVAARNHCRIEDGDPIFAVSTINRLMLDEVVEGLIVRRWRRNHRVRDLGARGGCSCRQAAGRRNPHLDFSVEGGDRGRYQHCERPKL